MPQWRKLYTKSLDSIDINNMPNDFTRLMWLLLPLGLDREGRGLNNTTWIKSKIFPLREDVTQEMISDVLSWLQERDMIRCYSSEGRPYFYVVNWSKYQGDCSREKGSEIPEPVLTTNSRLTHDLLTERSCSDSDSDSDSTIAAEGAASAKPRKKSERQKALSTLENEFSTITAIPLPGRATDRQKLSASAGWWQPLTQIWEMENQDTSKSLVLIRSAIAKMRKDSLTIAAPRSILKVAIAIYGNGKCDSAERPAERPATVYR